MLLKLLLKKEFIQALNSSSLDFSWATLIINPYFLAHMLSSIVFKGAQKRTSDCFIIFI